VCIGKRRRYLKKNRRLRERILTGGQKKERTRSIKARGGGGGGGGGGMGGKELGSGGGATMHDLRPGRTSEKKRSHAGERKGGTLTYNASTRTDCSLPGTGGGTPQIRALFARRGGKRKAQRRGKPKYATNRATEGTKERKDECANRGVWADYAGITVNNKREKLSREEEAKKVPNIASSTECRGIGL